jgi:hypothetical protein
MTFRLDEGTVVSVSYRRDETEARITCVVLRVGDRHVELLPVTPALPPPADVIVDVELGSKQFRATVQRSTRDVFSLLRPVDVGSASMSA